MYSKDETIPDPARVPTPCGYHILIAIPSISTTTKSGLIKMTEMMKKQEESASVIGRVIEIGPDAYKDERRFPGGPWCKPGDYVIFRSYSGTRIKVDGQEFRLINDDTIEGVVEDPTGYERAF